MPKKPSKPAPDQLTIPGIELDAQQKFDFARPGGRTTAKASKAAKETPGDSEHLPPNLGKPVKVKVPDFSDPKRRKTCLEVDFPIVPINALSALEGNAGKPIRNKTVHRVPIRERFEQARLRPRTEMKTELDQAQFLIGAAMPGSGVNIEEELGRDTWLVRRSVEAVLDWYAKTAVEPEIQQAAKLAGDQLRRSREQNSERIREEQGFLFDDLHEETDHAGDDWQPLETPRVQYRLVVRTPHAVGHRWRCGPVARRAGLARYGLPRQTAEPPQGGSRRTFADRADAASDA